MRIHSQRRRWLAVTAVISASVITLSACASGDEPEAESGPVTISWWSWNPDQETAGQYIEAFEADHPDINVEHRFIQYSDFVNTTQLALTSGAGPDVFGVQVGALTQQFAPLAEDLTPALEEAMGDGWREMLTATDQLVADDKQVALPWMITGGGLTWANQTLIDELGLEMPESREELDEFCAAVADAGKTCVVHGAQDAWQNIDVYQTIANQIAPGLFYEALAGETSFDAPEFVEAFEVWAGLFDGGVFQEGALATTAYPDANDAFHSGEAALIMFGSWQNSDTTQARVDQYAEIYGNPEIASWEFVPYFTPLLVEGGTPGAMFGGPDVGFALSSSSENKEAATTFLLWLTAMEDGQTIMAKNILQPSLKSVPLDLSGVITDRQREQLESQGPALGDLVGQREIDSADVRTALGDALAAVASGQTSPGDAARIVQAAIDAQQ